MAVRAIRTWGDPVLRTGCDPVVDFDHRLRALVEDLLDTVREPGRAGVAANQIGVTLRVFAYNVDDRVDYLVNPVLVETSGEQDDEEGCLSVPGLWYPTRRARRAVAAGVDVAGRPRTVGGEGLMARCLQHEIDHLDGRLYLDRLEPVHRRAAVRTLIDRPAP